MTPDPGSPSLPPRRGRGAWVAIGVIGLAAAGAGWVEWDVSWAAPWVATAVRRETGWSVEIGRVWVTPWRGLRAQDVKVQPPGGGWVHALGVSVRYAPSDVRHGRVTSWWRAGPIRMDPGSWKIRRPGAVAQLSERPIAEAFQGTVTVGLGMVRMERLRIRGWALRGAGAAAWERGAARYWLRGQIAAPVLEALGFHKVRGTWAWFVYRVEGPVQHPTVVFRSRFWSLTLKPNGGPS